MRSEVNTGTSFPSLQPCGDHSVLAACSSAAWLHPKLGCYSHELILGDEDGLYKQKALRSSLKHHCSRRGLGKGGWPPSLPWVGLVSAARWSTAGSGNLRVQPLLRCLCWFLGGGVGNLSVLIWQCGKKEKRSFDTWKAFTKGQFLINKLNHLSSPKFFLAKEFPAYCSFIERALKGLMSVWALTCWVCSQAACLPCPLKLEEQAGNSRLPSRANRLISRGRSAPNNLLCQMDASVLIYVLKITGHRCARHCGLDPAFVAFSGENDVGFSDPTA